MNITGGVTFSGSMAIRDQFPIAVAANIAAQSLTTGAAMTSFNPFASVSGGVAPYVYSYTGTLPTGITQNTSTGVVSGTPTAGYSTATVTFRVADSAGIVAAVTSPVSFTATVPTYTVNYLVVAGGGSGGVLAGGGGGGGGLLSGSTTLSGGTSYTISVGGGAQYVGSGQGKNGFSSNITSPAPGFTTITTTGGGGGGATPIVNGALGGSGGGGGYPGGSGNFTGTPGQGFPGSPSPATTNVSGGGGGAGGAGSGNTGGPGYTWPFTGNTYAGGGSGGVAPSPGNPVSGGPGGGGSGGPASGNFPATPGTLGTGGGGGGGEYPNAGGPGVVILAVPTPNYPSVSAPGAVVTTPPAAPGYTVLTWNAPSVAVSSIYTFTA